MSLPVYTYVQLNNQLLPVVQDSYSMQWNRAFSSQLAGNIIRLNFIDRGPGIRVYSFSTYLITWPPGSIPYQNGITQTWDQQLAALEASFAEVAKVLQFTDPFGRPAGISSSYGVYFTSYTLSVHKSGTAEQEILIAQIEVTEATQTVN